MTERKEDRDSDRKTDREERERDRLTEREIERGRHSETETFGNHENSINYQQTSYTFRNESALLNYHELYRKTSKFKDQKNITLLYNRFSNACVFAQTCPPSHDLFTDSNINFLSYHNDE